MNNLTVTWEGVNTFGNIFVIREDGNILHIGCKGWIANRWLKLTGENLSI